MELLSSVKRKTRVSSSSATLSTEGILSPENKRIKDLEDELSCHESAIETAASVLCEMSATSAEQGDKNKMDIILDKLEKLDLMATHTAADIKSLQETVDKVNLTVAGLQKDFLWVEKDLKNVTVKTRELEASIVSLNQDVEEGKASLEKSNQKNNEEINKLRLQLLNYEVYHRRENLRFYGISEEGEAEDTKETLLKCLENRFKMANARDIEFQRVHRLGKRSDKKGKPRVIIARFLRYTDREAVFSLRASLDKESKVGIGPDLPKDVVDMRKPLIPKMLEVRKQGKHAAFSRAEPYKLLIDGKQFN